MLTGFCQLILSRMAEDVMNNGRDFEDLAMGLIRLVSGWACERGVPVSSLHAAVSAGEGDYLGHGTGMTVAIPITTEN
jgi:hypothetical protein